MMVLTSIAVIGLALFLAGLYVAAEFAIGAAHRTKIGQPAAQNDSRARMILRILEDNNRLNSYIAACQIGITIATLALGAFAQVYVAGLLAGPMAQLFAGWISPLAAARFGHALAVLGVLLLIGGMQVILGELFPKSVALQYPEAIALAVAWPMRLSLILFALPVWLFRATTRAILRLLGLKEEDFVGRARSVEEIEELVTTSHEGGLLDDNERRLLRNALRMRDLTARQVMVHRTRIASAPVDVTPLELMRMAIDAGFSRIPIHGDSIDDIVGFVHVKDVFRLYNEGVSDIRSVIRDVVYVPETLSINDVWDQLNRQNRYLAIVFDEFGGTAGLLTLEDVIEEIFGELQDEFDDEAAVIARDKEGRIYLRGDLLIADVNEYLDLDLPEESADTLSGLVFSLLGRPPVVGDEVRSEDVLIRVETMEDLGVGEVSLLLPPGDEESPFTEWDIADYE
ncbi:MAG TPA: hemolysin family protein [Promineifilum sp.]|nr:hemolysin family protein [Promineifilum sp.]HRQ15144.1 hemolysin family protein [Promineifilum sp.]